MIYINEKAPKSRPSAASKARRVLVGTLAASVIFVACGSDSGGSDSDSSASGSASSSAESSSAASASLVGTSTVDAGTILVDTKGLSLYGFTDDADGTPTCVDGCAGAWPPVLVDSADLPADLDSAVFSVVERPDGSHQLKAGKWPLYLFSGDAAAGDTTGQGSGGIWFLATPEGGLIK